MVRHLSEDGRRRGVRLARVARFERDGIAVPHEQLTVHWAGVVRIHSVFELPDSGWFGGCVATRHGQAAQPDLMLLGDGAAASLQP